MKPMNANELLAGLALARPVPITAVVTDSRKVQPGELFLALRGERVDGHDYIPAAKGKGAVAALVSQESGELPCIVVENTLRAYGEIARHYREMLSFKVVGITGIDPEGEPTPTQLARVADQVRRAGVRTGYAESAATRAGELLIVVGSDTTVYNMIGNHKVTRRYSGLRARLTET